MEPTNSSSNPCTCTSCNDGDCCKKLEKTCKCNPCLCLAGSECCKTGECCPKENSCSCCNPCLCPSGSECCSNNSCGTQVQTDNKNDKPCDCPKENTCWENGSCKKLECCKK